MIEYQIIANKMIDTAMRNIYQKDRFFSDNS